MERYVIHVTKKCNLNCVYCYEKDKTSEYTWEEVKKVIDDICDYNKTFSIEFLGGEPMLRFDLIKQSYEYLESKKDVEVNEYIITTNGTILKDEYVKYLKKNKKLAVAVSIDGGYFANQLRITKDNKNSFDIVMPNIKKLIEENIHCSVHMVTHPYNVALIAKSIDLFFQAGIRNIGVGIIESTLQFGKEFKDEWIRQMKIVSDMIKEGKYPDLIIDELFFLKPIKDKRHYIRDDSGKVIAESYGRANNDIVENKNDDYNIVNAESPMSRYIHSMRFEVYSYHQNKLKEEEL